MVASKITFDKIELISTCHCDKFSEWSQKSCGNLKITPTFKLFSINCGEKSAELAKTTTRPLLEDMKGTLFPANPSL
jgi:hypothetical protein